MLRVDVENGYTIFTDSEFGDSEVRFPLDSGDAPDSEMQKAILESVFYKTFAKQECMNKIISILESYSNIIDVKVNNNLLHNAANMALNMINEYDKFSDNKSIRGL